MLDLLSRHISKFVILRKVSRYMIKHKTKVPFFAPFRVLYVSFEHHNFLKNSIMNSVNNEGHCNKRVMYKTGTCFKGLSSTNGSTYIHMYIPSTHPHH